jgi:CheY-like chemotaxis protein
VSRQARILLVDDRPENLIALDAILSPLNQILVPVRSGEQALRALEIEEFAVVLLDIVMPGMSGLETAARIKRDARLRYVPIIFLTAAIAGPEQPFLGYEAGAVDYLAKPFDPGVLKAKVSVFVDLYLKACQLHDQAELLGGRPLTDQLSGRLAAVEETLAALRKLPAVRQDAEAEEAAARLACRVGRLRNALDALGGPEPTDLAATGLGPAVPDAAAPDSAGPDSAAPDSGPQPLRPPTGPTSRHPARRS